MYDCYQEFPEFANFTGRQGPQDTWIVEGKSSITQYSLWEISAVTGQITSLDKRAEQATAACIAEPPGASTGLDASIIVWVATYDCFTPRPRLAVFTATQKDPRRWIVEGRDEGAVLYGIWIVDTDTGGITPQDQLASTTEGRTCFRPL